MQIFLISSTSNLLGLANRLVEEGHKVDFYGPGGNGYVEKVKHPYEAIKNCKFIVADGKLDSKVYNWARTFNKPIIGAHPLADMLNSDCYREYQIASKLGLSIPPTEVINDISDMYDKVLEWNSARTLIRYDRETISCDHQVWLAWAMTKLPLNKKILLQKPSWGEEIQVTGWFDGLKWARPFMLKTPKEQDLRVSSMLALYKREWLQQVIEPWEAFLRSLEYKGPIKVRALASKDKIQVMETKIGIEFPSLYAFLEGLKEPVGEFLNKIAFSVCNELDITTDYFSCAVVRTGLNEPEGAPIVGIDEGNKKHIFLGDVDVIESDIVIKKDPSWVYITSAHGRTVDESFGRMYFTHSQVRIPEPNIMTGVGQLHSQWFNQVRNLGYL